MRPNPRVLVVDDDHGILELMRSLLLQFSFEPVTASSGWEALRLAQEKKPDLLLVDMHMPGGLSGEDVIRELRSKDYGQIPVFILSGEPVDTAELSRLRADEAVMKPFDLPELISRMRQHLASVGSA